MYYHTLANQQHGDPPTRESGLPSDFQALPEEAQKTWFWFPLFSFFEAGVQSGKIPNEVLYKKTCSTYEFPSPRAATSKSFCCGAEAVKYVVVVRVVCR